MLLFHERSCEVIKPRWSKTWSWQAEADVLYLSLTLNHTYMMRRYTLSVMLSNVTVLVVTSVCVAEI